MKYLVTATRNYDDNPPEVEIIYQGDDLGEAIGTYNNTSDWQEPKLYKLV
jgi:hypothetical protein